MSLKPILWVALLLAALVVLFLLIFPTPQVQSSYPSLIQPAFLVEPNQCSQNACAVHCMVDTYFTGYNSYDSYAGWYDTAYDITGCADSEILSDIVLLIDIAAEILEAPGGYTMNCDQMMNGQGTACYRNQCQNNFCRYAPDLDVELTCDASGTLDAEFSNNSDNANTFNINNFLSIKRNDDSFTRIFNIPENLGFTNWITNSGLPECIPDQNGYVQDGCDLVLPFLKPDSAAWSTNDGVGFPWDGGLIDLSWFVTTDEGGIDSDLAKGIAVIKHDEDEFHVESGSNLSGIALYYINNYETDRITYEIQQWSAFSEVARFTVDECAEWSPCDVTETARDVDIYVVATSGQPNFILPGTYTFSLESSLKHDKDINDNKDTCSYEKDPDLPPETQPGFHFNNNLWYPLDVYRVVVPAGSTALSMQLDGIQSGSDFDLYLQRDKMPSKSDFLCRPYRGGSADEICTIDNPTPGDYYIVVDRFRNSGPYHLNIVLLPVPGTRTPTPTITKTPTPTRTPTRTKTATPGQCAVQFTVKAYAYKSANSEKSLPDARVLMQVDPNGPIFEVGTTDANGSYAGARLIPSNLLWRVGIQKDGYIFDVTSSDGSVFSEWMPGCQNMGFIFTAQSTPPPTKTPTRTPSPSAVTTSQVTFSGRTTWGDMTTPIQAVAIHLDVYYPYTSTDPYYQASTSTNSSGYYNFTVAIPKDAMVKVRAEKTGYIFTPTWSGTITSGTVQTLTYNFNTNTTRTPTITRTPSKTRTAVITKTPTPTRTRTPIPATSSNNLWGWVHYVNGSGIEGVRIVMEINSSDALVVIDTTDPDGNYKKYMDITENSRIRVWAEKEGYTFTPTYYEWIQGATGQDRRMDFSVDTSLSDNNPPTTPTPTRTVSPTRTPTKTRTITPTRTVTKTRTITPTRTPTKTRTITPTRTVTRTRTPTRTITPNPHPHSYTLRHAKEIRIMH